MHSSWIVPWSSALGAYCAALREPALQSLPLPPWPALLHGGTLLCWAPPFVASLLLGVIKLSRMTKPLFWAFASFRV